MSEITEAGGVFAATDLGRFWQNPLLAILPSIGGSRRVIFPLPGSDKAEFVHFLGARMNAGDLRAVIDRTYRLEAIVDADPYAETEQKTGIVVVVVAPADDSEPS